MSGATKSCRFSASLFKCVLVTTVLFVVTALRLLTPNSVTHVSNNSESDKTFPVYKKILFWTNYFFKPSELHKYNAFGGCPVSACQFTNNRSELDSSDAVVFYMIDWRKHDLPPRRRVRQRFIFYELEAPVKQLYMNPGNWHVPRNFFNWTMTYRLDSDIPVPFFYDAGLRTRPRNYRKGKTRWVVWIVSHCKTHSRREDYVRELRKHIPVDIYGKCGNQTCYVKGPRSCETLLRVDYLFYLAFENSVCTDYVTEKLAKAFKNDIVPVLLNGGNRSMFPQRSYVDVNDFATPKLLAEALYRVGGSDEIYNSYFAWRRKGHPMSLQGSLAPPTNGLCLLCHKLHHDHRRKWYGDVLAWWYPSKMCQENAAHAYLKTYTANIHAGASARLVAAHDKNSSHPF